MSEIDPFEQNKQPLLPQAVLITAAFIFADSLPNLTSYREDKKAEAAVLHVDPNYEGGGGREKGLRESTAKFVERQLTKIYELIDNVDEKTYDSRQAIIKRLKIIQFSLKVYYHNNVPIKLQDDIEQIISDMKEVKDGTWDGVQRANIKRRIEKFYEGYFEKKSELEEFKLKFSEEIDRVKQATEHWKGIDPKSDNSTNGNQI